MGCRDDLEKLLTAFLDGTGNALGLLEKLLQLCRAHRAILEPTLRSEGVEETQHAARRAVNILLAGNTHSVDLDAELMVALSKECSDLVGSSSLGNDAAAAVVVRTLAECVDEHFHPRILSAWSRAGRRNLTTNDLVPIVSPFQHPGFRQRYKDFSTAPWTLDRSVDRVRHATLVPDLPHDIRLLVEPEWNAVDQLGADSMVGCILPSGYDLSVSFKDAEGGRFFGTAPTEPRKLEAIALELVARADERGAVAALLPELSLDSSGVHAVAQWVENRANNIAFAVCGTHHTDVGGRRSNVAVLVSNSDHRIEQNKVIGMTWKPDGSAPAIREDIEQGATQVKLVFGSSWSAVVLICKDFLDAQLNDLVVRLGIALVLVPACSPRTVDFSNLVGSVASRSQGHVLVANKCSPGADEPDLAILARPVTSGNGTPCRQSSTAVTLPALALIQLNQGQWKLDD